jgi:hypothetical protein
VVNAVAARGVDVGSGAFEAGAQAVAGYVEGTGLNDAFLCRAWGSALLAGVLSFASPKESSQRKGDPRLRGRLRRLPCATRNAGRLRNSGLRPSNSPRRRPPALLRCSALHMGTRKAPGFEQQHGNWNATVGPKKCPKSKTPVWSGWFTGPLERRRVTQTLAEKGRGLSEAQRAEFRSPRQCRVTQGTGVAGADPGSPFLCLLSFGEAKESKTPLKGGKHKFRKPRKKQTETTNP